MPSARITCKRRVSRSQKLVRASKCASSCDAGESHSRPTESCWADLRSWTVESAAVAVRLTDV